LRFLRLTLRNRKEFLRRVSQRSRRVAQRIKKQYLFLSKSKILQLSNNYFKFKQFTIFQDKTAMKVGVDSVVLGAWTNVENVNFVLDIGTGTGLLALMLAQKTKAQITAVEMDENAFNQAVENINSSKWADRVEVLHIPFQEFANKTEKRFGLLICNPPYFSASLKSPDKNRSIARHDDNLSLGDLFFGAKQLLPENGSLNLIYPYLQKEQLFSIAEKHGFYPAKVLNLKANEKKEIYRFVVKFVLQKTDAKTKELEIRNTETNDYSVGFKQLTKDYYPNQSHNKT